MWPKYLDIDGKNCAAIMRKLGKKLDILMNPSKFYISMT